MLKLYAKFYMVWVNILTKKSEQQKEQEHLDHVLSLIQDRIKIVEKSISGAQSEAQDLNAHFFDDLKLDYDGYSTSMETALSIHQQQQLLEERQNAWQHATKQLSTLQRLNKRPYFARIDFQEQNEKPETIYIGLGSFADKNDQFLIYDWRAPISSIYYDGKLGSVTYYAPDGEQEVLMTKKRQFSIKDGQIINMFDTNESIGDQMLINVLNEKSSTQMKSIVTTIQREQNKIIRNTTADLLFVQGSAGSGKTSAILQRIAYLLYRYRGNLVSSDVIMFSPNQLFNDYVKNVLPEMGEQNMVQMTYRQFVSRRVPAFKVESLFDQFEDQNKNPKIAKLKDSLEFFEAINHYSKHLIKHGVVFKNIYFKDKEKPFFDKDYIKDIYYSFNENYNLRNRIEATREKLVARLNESISAEAKKAWVAKYLESISKEELNKLYDRPDQEFASSTEEERFLSKKIVINSLKQVLRKVNANSFFNIRAQYLAFLRAIPKMIDLQQYGISEKEWYDHIELVKQNFVRKQIKITDISSYLYLYDVITGRRVNYEMRYAFIDEIQDYTPFQLAYLKYNFPRAKFTMLGDLNQAIFTKDDSLTLLDKVKQLFISEKIELIKLTKSYRSTKQITDFTKQILKSGELIEAFDRNGAKPTIWHCDNASAVHKINDILIANNQEKLTTAIITKTLEEARDLTTKLKSESIKVTLIATANQRLVPGVLVIPSYLAKGLEFDAVIAWQVNNTNYHKEDERQLLYTITSRAMYKLDLIYTDELSDLLREIKVDTCKWS